MRGVKTIPFSEVREFYKRTHPNGCWFSKGAMAFFNTTLPRVAYEGNAGILFITKERCPVTNRFYYNVRRQLPDGSIKGVGKFNDNRTRSEALYHIGKMHEEGGEVQITLFGKMESHMASSSCPVG